MATKTRLTGMPLSMRLKTIRNDAGYTQQELAEGTGICLKSVVNYENPRYGRARTKSAVRVWAQFCGRTYEEVMTDGRRGKEISPRACYGGSPFLNARSDVTSPDTILTRVENVAIGA